MGLRQDKLACEIKDLLASCLISNQVGDPGLDGLSITHAKVSPDLQIASVYFRVFNPENQEVSFQALKRSKGFLKKHLSRNLKIRRIPDLNFFYDESVEYGARIESLLQLAKTR